MIFISSLAPASNDATIWASTSELILPLVNKSAICATFSEIV
eukprot:CAMPEP_0171349508 /NCGR_PEP_ID=MMETSP0878-20121228/33882_1 /TAXON_ID=67004 /ORGANISM="Thalassiosira weissflogii, Strain CCMP1336" /LENGTH=41 /DNA_ID= /DNA_START= /DNA_END= /DNA_ORIENTATION=